MGKAFRQVTDDPDKAEVITLEWAAATAEDYFDQLQTYMECCSKSTDGKERRKYYESAMEALGHLLIANQMIGALMDEELLCQYIFGLIPVEIVEWSPTGSVEQEGN